MFRVLMWYPALTKEMLLRWSYSTCPNLGGLSGSSTLGWVGMCTGKLFRKSEPSKTTIIPGKKGMILIKRAIFCLSSFVSMARDLDPKLLVLFDLLSSIPKIRTLFPHNIEGITYSIWFSARLFVYSYR